MASSPNDESRRISANVSAALRDSGYTQQKVVNAIQAAGHRVSLTTLNRSICGRRAFNTTELAVIAHILDVDVSSLITYTATRERVAS